MGKITFIEVDKTYFDVNIQQRFTFQQFNYFDSMYTYPVTMFIFCYGRQNKYPCYQMNFVKQDLLIKSFDCS